MRAIYYRKIKAHLRERSLRGKNKRLKKQKELLRNVYSCTKLVN